MELKNFNVIFCGKFLCNILFIYFFKLPSFFFPYPQILYQFVPFWEFYFARTSPSNVSKINNTHRHLQHLPFLPFYQQPNLYCIWSKSKHFLYFPNSHDKRQLTQIIFSGSDANCSWHNTVSDIITGWFQSTDDKTFHCVTLFVSQPFRHIFTRLHSWVRTDSVTYFHIGYAELGSWPV